MTQKIEISIGLEELVAALAAAGHKDEARGILAGTYGTLSAEQESGRLIAANHSLLSRGLSKFVDQKIELGAEMQTILNGMLASKATLRAGKSGPAGEEILSFYPQKTGWMKHQVSLGVVHRFRLPIGKEDAGTELGSFFEVKSGEKVTPLEVLLPASLMTDLAAQGRRSFDAILDYLKTNAANSGDAALPLFAEDFRNNRWRGSLVWVERSSQDSLAMKGALLLQGAHRLWVIQSDQGSANEAKMKARVLAGSAFQEWLTAFIADL